MRLFYESKLFTAILYHIPRGLSRAFLSPRELSPNIDKNRLVCYNLRAGTLKPYGGEEVGIMEAMMSFAISVEAGIAANLIWYLICKWLDRNNRR